MKQLVYVLVLCLTGCSSWIKDRLLIKENLLDTAPKNAAQVRYPEWGTTVTSQSTLNAPQRQQQRQREASVRATHSPATLALEAFLSNHGIEYEMVPGNFSLIHVKRPILFAVNSAKVDANTELWLRKIGDYLASHAEIEVVLDGHTDSAGGQRYNEMLSQKRANAVKAYLIGPWHSTNSIYTRSFGAQLPVCQGQSCNRRVEMYFIVPS